MKIVILGLSSDDVSDDLREVQLLLGDAIEAALASVSLEAPLQTLYFTPIITRPGIGPFDDKLSYLRREPGINAAIKVPHRDWSQGDKRHRVNLVTQALLKVIDQVKSTKLDVQTKSRLREVIETARRAALSQVGARM